MIVSPRLRPLIPALLLAAAALGARADDDLLDPSVIRHRTDTASALPKPADPRNSPTAARVMAARIVRSLDGLTLTAARLSAAGLTPDTAAPAQAAQLRQVMYGLNLWRTGLAFERKLILRQDSERQTAYEQQRSRAEDQIARLRADIALANDSHGAHAAELANAVKDSTGRRDRVRDKLTADIAAADTAQRQLDNLQLLAQAAPGNALPASLSEELTRRTDQWHALKNVVSQDRTALADAERAVAVAQARLDALNHLPEAAALQKELAVWQSTEDRLDEQRAGERRALQRALADADAAADTERKTLESYLARGNLRDVLKLPPVSANFTPGSGFAELGGLYRMGDTAAIPGQGPLPEVNDFIVAFMAATPNNSASLVPDKRP